MRAISIYQVLKLFWLVVTGCHEFYCPIHSGFLIIPMDELIFFRGVAKNHQPVFTGYIPKSSELRLTQPSLFRGAPRHGDGGEALEAFRGRVGESGGSVVEHQRRDHSGGRDAWQNGGCFSQPWLMWNSY